jgi:hypothetical protein
MNPFKSGLLAGVLLGSVTAATVSAQFGTSANSPVRPPEAMNNAERRQALARCDGMPIGPAKDRCMDDLLVNRNAAAANDRDGSGGMGSRIGDGRTGAPGIGTGPASVDEARRPGQGARSATPSTP